MDPEEYEDHYYDPREVEKLEREAAKNQFAEWCNEGYEMLSQKMSLTDVAEKDEAHMAMRRMLGYFIDEEEYEKCRVIKTVLDTNFPGNTAPLFDYRNI